MRVYLKAAITVEIERSESASPLRDERFRVESTGRFNADLRALRSRSYDRCQCCEEQLPRDVAAYAGYALDGSARYVGACCLPEIHELATHVYWWWEADKRVEPDTALWRYMDLAKFLLLLEEKTLFFSRADKFDDPFEGASGLATREKEWDDFYLAHFRDVVRTPLPGGTPVPDEAVEQNAQRLLASIRQIAARDRRTTFVSCWHANSGESEALWRLYCPPGSSGVAIKTTANRLLHALDPSARIEIGRVQYVDFRRSFAGFHDRIFCKRKSLAHESGVRAVCRGNLSDDWAGLPVSVDLSALLEQVVPSPFAPAWFPNLLASLVGRFGLKVPIEDSELLAQPFF